ncbi:MAG: hypothetical protein INR65_20860, partial [Gluconacetobacter diazotrophicus]|nr:hypothetical protein [Gluconacetobacter diazotrophicus]
PLLGLGVMRSVEKIQRVAGPLMGTPAPAPAAPVVRAAVPAAAANIAVDGMLRRAALADLLSRPPRNPPAAAAPASAPPPPSPTAVPPPRDSYRIRAACEQQWPAHRGDCAGFVRAVGSELGVAVSGDANRIAAALLAGGAWHGLEDGRAAAQAAADGRFVVGGLSGDRQAEPGPHGHVVVVVEGPLRDGRYPTAYWGSLGGTPACNRTVNWAWTAADRDKVAYAAYDP